MVMVMRVAFRRSVTGRRAEDPHCFVEEEKGKESRKDRGLQQDNKIRSVAALPSLPQRARLTPMITFLFSSTITKRTSCESSSPAAAAAGSSDAPPMNA